MGLSRSALSHLDSAYNLFTRVSDTARAGKILVSSLVESLYPTLQKISLAHPSQTTRASCGCTRKCGSLAKWNCDPALFLWPKDQKRSGRTVCVGWHDEACFSPIAFFTLTLKSDLTALVSACRSGFSSLSDSPSRVFEFKYLAKLYAYPKSQRQHQHESQRLLLKQYSHFTWSTTRRDVDAVSNASSLAAAATSAPTAASSSSTFARHVDGHHKPTQSFVLWKWIRTRIWERLCCITSRTEDENPTNTRFPRFLAKFYGAVY